MFKLLAAHVVASLAGTALALVVVAAAGGLLFLEGRRANQRHLGARLAATGLCVLALGALGWQLREPTLRTDAAVTEATLVTAGAAAEPAKQDRRRRFALPEAARAHPEASVVPDAAFLRRQFPGLNRLRIIGDGLDPADIGVLRGLRVEYTRPQTDAGGRSIRFLSAPRELPLGQPLVVQGRVGGCQPGEAVALRLEGPDGSVAEATTELADASGNAAFRVQGASPTAAGRYQWQLRLAHEKSAGANAPATGGMTLGIAVVAPTLPRLLLLESAPRFDTGALRRWYEGAGGSLKIRTLVGKDHYRYADTLAPNGVPTVPPFGAIDATLLAGVDLVLADVPTLRALPPGERDALTAAVTDTGLGVLILADDSVLPPANGDVLLPWTLRARSSDGLAPGDQSTARLQWPGQTQATDVPVPVVPGEILPSAGQRALLGDRQGHTLAAAAARGQGQLALTLVQDTSRWQRAGDPGAFAAYWAFLGGQLARPVEPGGGRWTLVEGEAGPVFVDHPLTLRWSGQPGQPPGDATVVSAGGSNHEEVTTLALTREPLAAGAWNATFWPRREGWHRVTLARGERTTAALDFYVEAAESWPGLASERRQVATERRAEWSEEGGKVVGAGQTTAHGWPGLAPAWWAGLFFLAAGFLWVERRMVG